MSSWGYTDNVAIAGTVTTYTANGNVVGSSTYFTSNVKDGDYLFIAGGKYQVQNVINNTVLTLTGPTATAGASRTAYLQQGPKFLSNLNGAYSIYASNTRTPNIVTIQNVYGVTLNEMLSNSVSSLSVGTAGNYQTAAKANTTVTISTTGLTQPLVNATATINYTGANVTSFTITNPGAGYTVAAQTNTTATIATTGATIPLENATATVNFTTGTALSNAGHQGWVTYNTYIDANGGVREKSEVLVAMSKNFTNATAGDNDPDDSIFPH